MKKYSRLSSAAVMIGALRVKGNNFCDFFLFPCTMQLFQNSRKNLLPGLQILFFITIVRGGINKTYIAASPESVPIYLNNSITFQVMPCYLGVRMR